MTECIGGECVKSGHDEKRNVTSIERKLNERVNGFTHTFI